MQQAQSLLALKLGSSKVEVASGNCDCRDRAILLQVGSTHATKLDVDDMDCALRLCVKVEVEIDT